MRREGRGIVELMSRVSEAIARLRVSSLIRFETVEGGSGLLQSDVSVLGRV